MTTLRRLLIGAGFIGTIVGAGALRRKECTWKDRVLELESANPRTRSDATGAMTIMLAHASTQRGVIIEVPAGTSAKITGCAIATGINWRRADHAPRTNSAANVGNTNSAANVGNRCLSYADRPRAEPLPGGLASRARCIIGAWSVSPCCLIAWLVTDSTASTKPPSAIARLHKRAIPTRPKSFNPSPRGGGWQRPPVTFFYRIRFQNLLSPTIVGEPKRRAIDALFRSCGRQTRPAKFARFGPINLKRMPATRTIRVPSMTPASGSSPLRNRCRSSSRVGDRLYGCGCSPDRTRLTPNFPANREINREF